MKKAAKEILIRIKEIKEHSFNLKSFSNLTEDLVFGKNIQMGIAFKFDANLEEDIFHFFTLIKYKTIIEDVEQILVELETEIIFEVKDLSKVVKKLEDEDQMNIDDDFIKTMAGVAIGTTRGMLASNTKGSVLSKFPLPILNPEEILKTVKQ